MTHFLTREDLLQWLEKNCTRKAVVRALQEGTVEHLGAFTKLGPNSEPGWIVKVTGEHGKVWHVEIIAWRKRYAIFISGLEPPWKHWDGCANILTRKKPLQDGDNEFEYARLRDERRAEIEKQNRAFKNTKPESKSKSEGT